MKGIKKSLTSRLLLYFVCLTATGQEPRLILEGVGGTGDVGQADLLYPLFSSPYSLFYGDLAGKYELRTSENSLSAGLGYRKQNQNAIWGGYLFLDYNESECDHHYWVLSPGIEKLATCYDLHLNAYVPLKDRHNEDHFFFSGLNSCGQNGNCQFVEFQGHQQFEHQFVRFEEVGYGLDLSVGTRFINPLSPSPFLQCVNLKGGGYYYHMNDTTDIVGAAARLEVPFNPRVSALLEAGYDNNTHGAVVVGLKYQFGHRVNGCGTLCDRYYEPTYRNIATFDRGTSIPVKRGFKDEGLFLRRDNIFFFSDEGTAVLGDPNAGTFEDPFASDQFVQMTVDAIGGNTNLFLNSGDYRINGVFNSSITLSNNQSIYGRTSDFKCSAAGDERPILEGGIDLVSTHNVIDSIKLINEGTNVEGVLIGVSLENADVLLCNDLIQVNTISGDNANQNIAIGIAANDSNIMLNSTELDVRAFVSGVNSGTNAAMGIGNFNADFVNNEVTILGSTISSSTQVVEDNNGANAATGIGNNALSVDQGTVIANFTGNNFLIECSQILSEAFVGGDNTIPSGSPVAFASNQVTSIGNNAIGLNADVTAEFTGNSFSLLNSTIVNQAHISGSNTTTVPFGTGQFFLVVVNQASNIGNNVLAQTNGGLRADFSGNTLTVGYSTLTNQAFVDGDNSIISVTNLAISLASNQAMNIGNNGVSSNGSTTNADFIGNSVALFHMNILNQAVIDGNNLANITTSVIDLVASNQATSVGNNAISLANGDISEEFTQNTLSFGCSAMINQAFIGMDNVVNSNLVSGHSNVGTLNQACGLGTSGINLDGDSTSTDFMQNEITLQNLNLTNEAQINGNNFPLAPNSALTVVSGQNLAVGMGNSVFVLGISPNSATSNFVNNDLNLQRVDLLDRAWIGGNNLATANTMNQANAYNQGIAIGNNVALSLSGGSPTVTTAFEENNFAILDSLIVDQAQIDGSSISTTTTSTAVVLNQAIGIGNSITDDGFGFVAATASDFSTNTFSIECSELVSHSTIAGNNTSNSSRAEALNEAIEIGNFAFSSENLAATSADFVENSFFTHCFGISAQAQVGGDNLGNNEAIGIGNQLFPISGTLNSAFSANEFQLSALEMNITANILGDNIGVNGANGVDVNDMGESGSNLLIDDSIINVFAGIEGNNTGMNTALGLNAMTNSLITITNSVVNVTALSNGTNAAIGKEGNVVAKNTVFKVHG